MRVHHYLARARQLYGPREAVIDGSKRFTYAEFAGRCYQLARALAELGVVQGDRVGIVSPNTHHFLEAFFGVACLGAAIVPLNYRLIGDDFQYCLDHAGAKVVLADSELTSTVDEIRDRLPSVEHYLVAGGSAPGWLDWEELLAGQSSDPLPDPDTAEEDLVSINYTSGTTARPKGVMLTHANFVTNAYNFIGHFGISHHDTALWTLPMFHCNGWGGVYALTGM
ncbi:MAG: AMP-binding protein, partial [Candidatus Eremiobacteraeota bacterium]|nr:AMP-binding protein [Candidatus Eremiobacteraeota bacterium]